VQIDLICALSPKIVNHQPAAHIGGSARGYKELAAPLVVPTVAQQSGSHAVCLCSASAGREQPHLPRLG
jgi:hypothetical protein